MWTTVTNPDQTAITYELKTEHTKAILATHKNSNEYNLTMCFDNIDSIHSIQFNSDDENNAKHYAKERMRHFLNAKIQEIKEMRDELL